MNTDDRAEEEPVGRHTHFSQMTRIQDPDKPELRDQKPECRIAANAALYLAKHPSKLAGKHRQTYLRLRHHLRRHARLYLHLNLYLNLDLNLYPSLLRAFLAK